MELVYFFRHRNKAHTLLSNIGIGQQYKKSEKQWPRRHLLKITQNISSAHTNSTFMLACMSLHMQIRVILSIVYTHSCPSPHG
jgi:hypothetical protein